MGTEPLQKQCHKSFLCTMSSTESEWIERHVRRIPTLPVHQVWLLQRNVRGNGGIHFDICLVTSSHLQCSEAAVILSIFSLSNCLKMTRDWKSRKYTILKFIKPKASEKISLSERIGCCNPCATLTRQKQWLLNDFHVRMRWILSYFGKTSFRHYHKFISL
jgi:hypothetical protein